MAGLIERTRRALQAAQEATPQRPGRGVEGLQREREERAWRFLEALTEGNAEALPRYVSRALLAQLFHVTPTAAAGLLQAVRVQPKGTPWRDYAQVQREHEETTREAME
jgi:hypothetical protein